MERNACCEIANIPINRLLATVSIGERARRKHRNFTHLVHCDTPIPTEIKYLLPF
jgi:hypothetical protein